MRWTSALVLFLGLLVSAQEGGSITDEQLEIWQDSDMTTNIWKLIHGHDNAGLKELIEKEPKAVHLRSADGRGALFWAYEYGNEAAVQLLISSGSPADAKDAKGLSPRDMASAPVEDDAYEE